MAKSDSAEKDVVALKKKASASVEKKMDVDGMEEDKKEEKSKYKVSSPKDVSLPKAAKILSKFASEDYGASPAFLLYLNRALEAFDELVQLHKELRGSGPESRSKSRRRSGYQDEVEGPENSMRSFGGDEGKVADGERHELDVYRFNSINVEAKKKKKSGINGAVKKEEEGNSERSGCNSVESKRRKKELKKIKKGGEW